MEQSKNNKYIFFVFVKSQRKQKEQITPAIAKAILCLFFFWL